MTPIDQRLRRLSRWTLRITFIDGSALCLCLPPVAGGGGRPIVDQWRQS